MIQLLDRFGFGYAANIRGPVHYLTGCPRRVPLVTVATVVMATMDAATLAYNLPETPGGVLWHVGSRLASLWFMLGAARPCARELDEGTADVLPAVYPEVLWVARIVLALFLGALASGIALGTLGIELGTPRPKGPPVAVLAMLAMMAGSWIAAHQGGTGKATLAGHVRQVLHRRSPSLAGVKG